MHYIKAKDINHFDEFDVGTDGEASASPDALVTLRKYIQEMIDLEEVVETIEGDLKAAKQSLQTLRTGRLPDLMAEIQSDHFTHNGWECKVTNFVNGSLPKGEKEREDALNWLKDHDGEGLIRTEVKLTFGVSQHNEAVNLAEELIEEGHPVKMDLGVNAMQLKAYASERIRNGEDIDADTLGLYTGKVVKATKVKKK